MNQDLKNLGPQIKKLGKKISVHFSFIVIIAVLLAYLYAVWTIGSLAMAEPTMEAENTALKDTKAPKIDQNAINHILKLEKNSSAIHSLFEKARNNPFNE